MQRRYITVDVFTDRAFGGNPLAVVLDAGGLTTAQMQAIAAELTAPQKLKRLTQFSAEPAAACLSLSAADVKTDRHPPQIVSVGLSFLAVELASRDAVRRAKPDAAGFAKILPCDGIDAIY